MSIEPTRLIRFTAWSLEDYAFLLVRRDIPVNIKINARDFLLTAVPNIIGKFYGKVNFYKVVEHMRSLGYDIPYPEHPVEKGKGYRTGLFQPSAYHVEKWYFEVMERRDDEDLFAYFRRIGLFNLLIINQLKLTYLEI